MDAESISIKIAIVLFVVLIFVVGFRLGEWLPIKSETRIEPTIELVIVNNKVDTLYVYEKNTP